MRDNSRFSNLDWLSGSRFGSDLFLEVVALVLFVLVTISTILVIVLRLFLYTTFKRGLMMLSHFGGLVNL